MPSNIGPKSTKQLRAWESLKDQAARSATGSAKDAADAEELRRRRENSEAHDEMTKKSKAEIARRLYNRSNHK